VAVDGAEVVVGPDGVDEVELLLTPHAGAPARSLQKGASGGELSRVMLAVEVVFAGADGVPTLVFDEVDAGVGGKAAVEVGRRLARLARRHQVLVVTHLPQVAAYADRHLTVVKSDDGFVTTSGVKVLEDGERVLELSRMLAGLEGSDSARAHAEELVATADNDKRAFA
jgi:DNA repair protein RecN (Recombination protein N)